MAAKNYQYAFCNKSCHGKWFGENYGFSGISGRKPKRKHDWDLIWKLEKEGLPQREIAERIGTSESVVTNILYRMRKGTGIAVKEAEAILTREGTK